MRARRERDLHAVPGDSARASEALKARAGADDERSMEVWGCHGAILCSNAVTTGLSWGSERVAIFHMIKSSMRS